MHTCAERASAIWEELYSRRQWMRQISHKHSTNFSFWRSKWKIPIRGSFNIGDSDSDQLKNVRDCNSNGNVGDELVSIFFLLFKSVDATRMARIIYHLGENENRESGCRAVMFVTWCGAIFIWISLSRNGKFSPGFFIHSFLVWCDASHVPLRRKTWRRVDMVDDETQTLEEGRHDPEIPTRDMIMKNGKAALCRNDCPVLLKSCSIQTLSWCAHYGPSNASEKRTWRRRVE